MNFGNCFVCDSECTNRCSICKLVYYCGRAHQQQDWRRHKLECSKPKVVITSIEAYSQYDEYIAKNDVGCFKITEVSDIENLKTYFEETDIPEEEHDTLVGLALEDKKEFVDIKSEKIPFGKIKDPYDHLKVTMPYISSVGMYFYCKNIVNRLIEKQFVPHFPHQLTINYYEPNEGLLSHTDNIDVIKEWVIGISLLSSCVITFTKGSDNEIEEKNYFLHPGSIMIQSGEVRYKWKHGISPESMHKIDNVSIARSSRISLQLSDFISTYFDHPDVQKLKI